MTKTVLTYDEALAEAQEFLANIPNLKKWCRERELSYQSVWRVMTPKNEYHDAKYPNILASVLRYKYPNQHVKGSIGYEIK